MQKSQGTSSVCKLSEDENSEGFDLEAGETWIYPTNYPLRDYQFNITEKALFKNTLVSLPTGLGKTFIAAVIMYNFYRWYPNGKIIFMAPTKPLVKQQLDACYNIMAIPTEVTAELTGTKHQQSRKEIWMTKRVFFITPQVLQNDLDHIPELGARIKCLVFDEAHKAKGQHAYCEVIRKVSNKNKYFRVLALSATPGNSIQDVLEVVNNLQISHIENKSEESADVKPYVFERSLERVLVPLGEKLEQTKREYEDVISRYTKMLIQYNVFRGNVCDMTKGKVFMIMRDFQQKNRGTPHYAEIMRNLSVCMTLYHALEVLIRHGLRSFFRFFEEHINDPLLRGNSGILKIMENIRQYLGPEPNIQPLPDGTYTKLSADTKFGHPKFYKLRDILIAHFSSNSDDNKNSSRAIVFFEYRESVMEAHALLLQSNPTIKPRIFMGQGAGITQRHQINVVKAFRDGVCNTLLSTSIGEEGLDVGEVDLIVCFDISNKSPIRMIQRMGRTGRKKAGQIIMLVTQGKEEETLKQCLIQKHNLANFDFSPEALANGFYNACPRMVPQHLQPRCNKIFMTVKKPTLTKNSKLKDFFRNASSTSSNFPQLPDEQINLVEHLPRNELCYKNFPSFEEVPIENFVKNFEKQRSLQPIGFVKHTKKSKILVDLLQLADSRRFNLPVTQMQIEKQLKQSDIRNLFANPIPKQTKTVKEPIFTDPNDELSEEISNYLSIQYSINQDCDICSLFFDCTKNFSYKNEQIPVKDWFIPDVKILDCLNEENLKKFKKTLCADEAELQKNDKELSDNCADEAKLQKNDKELSDNEFDNLDFTEIEGKANLKNKSFNYQSPLNFKNVVNKLRDNNNFEEIKELPRTEINETEVLSFFKLNSLAELFVDEEIAAKQPETPKKQSEPPTQGISPDLFTSEESNSPFKTTISPSPPLSEPNTSSIPVKITTPPSAEHIIPDSDDSMSPILTQRSSLSRKKLFSQKSPKDNNAHNLSISDICNLSQFGLSSDKLSQISKTETTNNNNEEIIDLTLSPELKIASQNREENSQKENQKPWTQLTFLPTQRSKRQGKQSQLGVTQMIRVVNKSQTQNKIKSQSGKPENKIKTQSRITQFLNRAPSPDSDDEFEPLFSFKKRANLSRLRMQKSQLQQSPKTQPKPQTPPSRIPSKNISSTESPPTRTPPTESPSTSTPSTKTPSMKTQSTKTLSMKTPTTKTLPMKTPSARTPSVKTPSRKALNNKPRTEIYSHFPSANSDDDFEEMISPIPKPKKKPKKNEFIVSEAEVSDCDYISADELSQENENNYDPSFISNEAPEICTQMHAQYLKSVKSPQKRGFFKIPQPKPLHNYSEIFSQPFQQDDSYESDSFCVGNAETTEEEELSELELMEMELKKKKKRRIGKVDRNLKRRRIICDNSDDE